jgi:hypothetical protein
MNFYKILNNQIFTDQDYSIVPIRDQDRYLIMKWRNEQIYHLRQKAILTEQDQDNYFINNIIPLFEQDEPEQLLFSYLKNGNCIGYGGLVHINWIDRNAEISFLIDSKLEETEFKMHWGIFLSLIETVAFSELNINKIYTYAYNIRPKLFEVLNENSYSNEAELNEHVIVNGVYFSVLIHSKFNKKNIKIA